MASVAMITKAKAWAKQNDDWSVVREKFLASQLSSAVTSVRK
jgi:hypothetical protein